MSAPRASVVIVSRHRAAALRRCLCALHQQDHPEFELIAVADPEACATLSLLAPRIKLIPFDEANISAARNLGLAQAAGEVVAFIDDDAVAEPTWLSRLCGPFAAARVAAATGFVRGRNGISYQWKAAMIDRLGIDTPLAVDARAPSLHGGDTTRAVKTQGTNMAFRRAALLAVGGFDPALHYYLDEAPVNLALAEAGQLTAVVPGAQVHHGYAESDRRRADRAPLSLHEIGASSAVFLRRHAPETAWGGALETLRAGQRRRLVAMMVDGRLAPPDVGRLMATLEAGIAEGRLRALPSRTPLAADPPPFRPLAHTGRRPGRVIAGRPWARRRLRARAREGVEAGEIVTLMRFSPTTLAHRMRFDAGGFWEQTGGLFGPSNRAGPRFQPARFSSRLRREIARIAAFRPVEPGIEG